MSKPAQITTTVMFADICRSTYLFTELGDENAAILITRVLKLAASIVTGHNGKVLRTKGDDVLCIFDNPSDALLAALDIHAQISHSPASAISECAIRIGINTGSVLLSEGDLLGDTVNTAARLSSIAKEGQTIVSSRTIDLLDALPAGLIRPIGDMHLKGKSGPETVFEFLDSNQEDDITLVGSAAIQFPKSSILSIRYNSSRAKLNYLLVRYLLGRAPDCDLMLDHALVSRHHAEIRYQNNEFVLTDFSTNGTTLIINGRPRTLHHSQAALRGNGSIFLGRTVYNQKFEIAFQASGGSRPITQTGN